MTHSEHALAWAYLSRVAEPPAPSVHRLVARYGPVEAADRIRRRELAIEFCDVLKATESRHHIDTAFADLDRIHAVGGRLMTPDDEDWPHLQMHTFTHVGVSTTKTLLPPLCLWVRGALETTELMRSSVAVVGTRAASSYGESVTNWFVSELVSQGATIISGAAFGIDALAHQCALANGGATVAVLACGVDVSYPRAHSSLLARIARHGAVVSEYAPGVTVAKHRFLQRNRLIAGLSNGVLVVEAGARSGSLNTAAWARSMGVVVVVPPGPITTATSVGTNQLLVQGLAAAVTHPLEVVSRVGPIGTIAPEAPRIARSTDSLAHRELSAYDALPAYGGIDLSGICTSSGLALSDARAAVARLEVDGFITCDGNEYFRKL